jgi:hypothetical protein
MSDEDEQRPRVTGWLEQPDAEAARLLPAVGHVVFAVASLEKALQLEVSRLLMARAATDAARFQTSLDKDLTALDSMTAGRLLTRLRELGVPDELDQRIRAVIDRRNDLIHHTFEDAVLVAALEGGRALDDAVGMLKQLVVDAGELAAELHLFAMPKLEAMFGMSLEAMADLIRTIDPAALPNDRSRAQLDAAKTFVAMSDLRLSLNETPNDPV